MRHETVGVGKMEKKNKTNNGVREYNLHQLKITSKH